MIFSLDPFSCTLILLSGATQVGFLGEADIPSDAMSEASFPDLYAPSPVGMLQEVVAAAPRQRGGGRTPVDHLEKRLANALPTPAVIYSLMCRYVSDLVGSSGNLEQPLSQIINKLMSLEKSAFDARSDSGTKHLRLQHQCLLDATGYILRDHIGDCYDALTKMLKSYPDSDDRERAAICILGAFGEAGLGKWETIFRAIQLKEDSDILLWVRFLHILRRVGPSAIPLLERIKKVSPEEDQRFFQNIIDGIRSEERG